MAIGFKSNAGMQVQGGTLLMNALFPLETKPKNTPVATAQLCYPLKLLAKTEITLKPETVRW